ncbi:MAG: CCA tRNA nucleotidyltransferase [Chloroflexota bacterium]
MPFTRINDFDRRLSPSLSAIVRLAGARAQQLGFRLYLVGGIVRDLLLGRSNLDIDLTVEGDALALAQSLAHNTDARLTSHRHFGTARLKYPGFILDMAMARKEMYPHPGALPTVRSGGIKEDLFRRDFTVNAMAVSLNPDSYGALIDPYGGKSDLEAGAIRVLHPGSFIDDATRIWRAIRYEQRLGFHIERTTLRQLRRSLAMLDTISADRLRREFERALDEETPDKVLRRAWRLGVLQKLHPSLRADRWLSTKYRLARNTAVPPLLRTIYTALLVSRLNPGECEAFLSRLNFPSHTARIVRDTVRLRQLSIELRAPRLKPSRIYKLVNDYDGVAVNIAALATNSSTERNRLRLYLDRLRHIQVSLGGRDLQMLGVPAGPPVGLVLRKLLTARLDGKLKSRKDEEDFVRRYFAKLTP